MTALALRVFWVSLTTSFVLLPLLLFSGKIGRRYRAKSCYLLWLLLALRLLIPVEVPLPQAPVTVELSAAVLEVPERPQSADVTLSTVPVQPQTAAAPELSLSLPQTAALVWLVGAVVVLCFQRKCYHAARKGLLKGAEEREDDQFLLTQLGSCLPVLRTDVGTPMTLGLLRPVVLLPRQTAEEDLTMMLRHELCHVRRGDLWYKLLFLLCAALHWFNPLVWHLARVAGETVELCCDEDVVAGQDAQFCRRYGQVLLHSAAMSTQVVLTTSFGSGDLKGRLMNLFVTKKKGAALVCAATCAALMMGSLVGCEATAAAPAPDPSAASVSSTEQVYAQALADSVVWDADGESLSFVLPELEQEKSWVVLISGRYVAQDGTSMSVHLDVSRECRQGENYTIPVLPRSAVNATEGKYSELGLYAYLQNGETVEEEIMVDLLSLQGEAVEQAEETAWVWPVKGHYTLSALYQKERIHPITGEHNNHNGIDIPADSGTGVIAAADGVVVTAEFDKQYGNYVILDHGNGLTTMYCHMVKPLVETGTQVQAGTYIGSVGQTGAATGSHLHFEVREANEPADPLYYYPGMSFEMTDGPVSVFLTD